MSRIPEARRAVGSCGVDASIPMPGGMDWNRGGRVSRYSPIMDGQPSQSRMLKTPGMGVKGELTSRQGAGVPGTVISLGRPNLGLGLGGCWLRAGLASLPTWLSLNLMELSIVSSINRCLTR